MVGLTYNLYHVTCLTHGLKTINWFEKIICKNKNNTNEKKLNRTVD